MRHIASFSAYFAILTNAVVISNYTCVTSAERSLLHAYFSLIFFSLYSFSCISCSPLSRCIICLHVVCSSVVWTCLVSRCAVFIQLGGLLFLNESEPPHLKNSNVSREQFKSSLKTWLFVQAYS